jgi:SAM-dependent methyltransferase
MWTIPERLVWAVKMLDVAPGDRVLEIGCGNGLAASLIAPRLTSGRILAIDRSAKAIALAERRNRAHIDAGVAAFRVATPAELWEAGANGERFDVSFAVNVNAFWLQSERTLPPLHSLLAPGGRCVLVLHPPDEARTRAFAADMPRHLDAAGFVVDRVLIEPMRPVAAACVIAHTKDTT